LERRQHAALRQRMQLQHQQAEERQLALEARILSQHRQLVVAAARQARPPACFMHCRPWAL
jgi:hypothetical protein